MDNTKESILKITTNAERTRSSVELRGSPEQHIYNLAILTHDICKMLNIPPFVMAGILVEFIAHYEKFAGEMVIDIGAIKRGRDST